MVERHPERELNSTTRLERNRIAASKLVDHPSIGKTIDGTILRRATRVLLHSPNFEEAMKSWIQIPDSFGSRDHMTPWQQDLVALSEEDVRVLYEQIQDIPSARQLREIVLERISGGHGHVICDQDQRHRARERKTKTPQIHARLAPDKSEALNDLLLRYPEVPLLETAKDARIIDLQRYRLSKISLLVHDLFDHLWLHDFLEQNGMFIRYKHLFDRVGNVNLVDSFNREGELVASIGYEWRSSFSPDRDFQQIFSIARIRRTITKSPRFGTPTTVDAVSLLDNTNPSDQEAKRLESMLSGIMVEAIESQRKFGYIKDISSPDPTKRFSLFDPEYFAFVIETNHILGTHHDELHHALTSVEGMCEEYLEAAIADDSPRPFTFKLDEVKTFDLDASSLSNERKAWIRDHFYHLAVKRSLV